MEVEIRDIRYFLMVAEEKSFTNAAAKLYISQPALSKKIAELEAETGLLLIHRRGKSIELTESGLVFQRRARRIVRDYNELMDEIQALKGGKSLHLSVAYGMAGHIAYLSEALRRMRMSSLHVDISLERMFNADILTAIEAHKIDIGIINRPELPEGSSLRFETLVPCGLCVFLHRGHPLYNRSTVRMGELQGERYITFDRDTSPRQYDLICSLCRENGLSAPSFHAADTSMFTLLLKVEQVVGIMPYTTSIMFDNTDIHRIPIQDVQGFDMIMAWDKENTNPAIPRFKEAFQ